jgi:MoaA/NifB/PqqE/SkfB family radical SAM enzyme
MLPWETVTDIIDQAVAMKIPSILFSWRGESTLYRVKSKNGEIKTFPDALDYARKAGILEITSLTHGQLLTEEMAHKIIQADPSWISFSIDGLGEDYNLIRTPRNKEGDKMYNAFIEVSKRIKMLSEIRKNYPESRTMIRTNTIYPAIKDYAEKYYEFMKTQGVDLITVNELMEWSRRDGDDIPFDGLDLDWGCQYPFQRLVVSASGVVLPCNGAVHQEDGLVIGVINSNPENKNLSSGIEIKEKYKRISLKEAWNSQKLNNIRNLHKEKRRIEINPGCRNCNHGIVKRGVTYVPEDWDDNNKAWKSKEQ